jgi:hypothetical protein
MPFCKDVNSRTLKCFVEPVVEEKSACIAPESAQAAFIAIVLATAIGGARHAVDWCFLKPQIVDFV